MDLKTAFKTRDCVTPRDMKFVLFWTERHDLVHCSGFILACLVENKATALCQLFSQRTKPSAG